MGESGDHESIAAHRGPIAAHREMPVDKKAAPQAEAETIADHREAPGDKKPAPQVACAWAWRGGADGSGASYVAELRSRACVRWEGWSCRLSRRKLRVSTC
mmetsp:Transcript_619/g.1579  ORF Transcript_619/g.1579 Transcript_619/m.1579 type:complete len:101 (+) Transcript_619:276-578(+)